ncbi:MAG: hypothetical protein IK020_11460 [Clostridiales bacterium]|nr:hypothetical protein [Clostridiales bacterium]
MERTIAKAETDLRSLHDLGNYPDAHLEIGNSKSKTSMYIVSEQTEGRRQYIPKKNIDLAKALATRSYIERFLRRAKDELAALEVYIRRVTEKSPEELYSNMCDARKALIRPLLVSDEVCARMWEQAPYIHGSSYPEMKIYPTKKGDLVRSKSEVLFADTYLDMGIPYRYEQELRFPDGAVLDPDFTLWDKKNRREIYHEHCGKMDDPGYRKRFMEKIDIYRRNGIYTGKNLILTFEGDGTTLNMKEMRTMISGLFQ